MRYVMKEKFFGGICHGDIRICHRVYVMAYVMIVYVMKICHHGDIRICHRVYVMAYVMIGICHEDMSSSTGHMSLRHMSSIYVIGVTRYVIAATRCHRKNSICHRYLSYVIAETRYVIMLCHMYTS